MIQSTQDLVSWPLILVWIPQLLKELFKLIKDHHLHHLHHLHPLMLHSLLRNQLHQAEFLRLEVVNNAAVFHPLSSVKIHSEVVKILLDQDSLIHV